MQRINIKVPDIGGFESVPVIEILVAVGDAVTKEQGLLVVESDKATMEIPAPQAGVIRTLKVKVGDKVSAGSVIAELEVAIGTLGSTTTQPELSPVSAQEKAAVAASANFPVSTAAVGAAVNQSKQPQTTYQGAVTHTCDLLVLGAGPGGYSAAFRAADLGMQTILVERYPTLGGVCLNVGCIPSKALLHNAAVIDEVQALAAHGIQFGKMKLDLDQLRGYKDKVVAKLTTGLVGMAKARKVQIVRGYGRFIDAHHLEVELTAGSGQERTTQKEVIRFQQAIIAAGSEPVSLPFIPKDPRIVDSTGALQLKGIPKRMLVIGGGIIGLEMATVYSTLGARVDVVEMLDGLMPGADRDLVKVWEKKNAPRFDHVWLQTKTVAVTAKREGIQVKMERLYPAAGESGAIEPPPYDLVLVAVGRGPNGKKISAENAGIAVGERGFISVDNQQRTNASHIFAIGDVVGQPMLAHKAVHEGHVAAEAAAGQKSFFDARQIPSVAYTDPEIAWAGLTEEQCRTQKIAYKKSVFPWAASGRAIANGRDEGFTKLLFDEISHRIIGGAIVGTHAGDLIGEICLAIEMGADAVDIAKTIHPHPTLGESIGMAAEVAEGSCTDLPPTRK